MFRACGRRDGSCCNKGGGVEEAVSRVLWVNLQRLFRQRKRLFAAHKTAHKGHFEQACVQARKQALTASRLEVGVQFNHALGISPAQQVDISPEEAAVFDLNIGNISEAGADRTYGLRVLNETNPDGAEIAINGVEVEDDLSFLVPFGESVQAVMSVFHGPQEYNYQDIKLQVFSPCEDDPLLSTVAGDLGGTFYRFDEKAFSVQYQVLCHPPQWGTVDPIDFQHSMNFTAKLHTDGEVSSDNYDRVGVFIDEQLHGVGQVKHIREFDNLANTHPYEVFLTVYGNDNALGRNLEFRVWDASEYRELGFVVEDYAFQTNAALGTPTSPVNITATSQIIGNLTFKDGWNWFLLNLLADDMTTNGVLGGIGPANKDIVRNQRQFSQFVNGAGRLAGQSGDVEQSVDVPDQPGAADRAGDHRLCGGRGTDPHPGRTRLELDQLLAAAEPGGQPGTGVAQFGQRRHHQEPV